MTRSLLLAGLFLASPYLAGCSSWRPVANHERWTLYELPDQAVARDRFEQAFDAAFAE
ncbi:MAG: hypothetical protein QF410_02680 [Planctomycetota bacterium]|nr:hypothetical protein [Planctomycetota bacterium]